MHFSIPDTQEFVDGAGNTYIGYNIHINGLFHCTVRYKQLHNLHEQLTKDLDVTLPPFPPKKFFPLTINQQEERRLALEKYIQSIGQNLAINGSEILNGFLLSAQQETIGGTLNNESLDIFLMNGCKVTLNVSTGEYSGLVLKKVCRHIKLSEQYHSYFALFIIAQDDDNVNVLRKLQDFESPFITYKNICGIGVKVVLAKCYWDTMYDLELFNDTVALNLLFIQTVAEIRRGWILVPKELQDHLSDLHNQEKKREYLDVARNLKYYGYIQFAPCFCDYPQPGTRVLVSIGDSKMNFRILSENNEEQETVFKVSRMRCWRITTLQNGTDRCEDSNDYSLELSFEYLMAKKQLQWITIASEQAILMSVCLQSMINESLLKSVGGKKVQEVSGKSWTYIMRDGQSRITMGSSSNEHINETKITACDNHSKPEPIMKKLADRLSAVKVKKDETKTVIHRPPKRHSTDGDIMENNAFRMIGDDDL